MPGKQAEKLPAKSKGEGSAPATKKNINPSAANRGRLNVSKALQMYVKGISQSDIARHFNVTPGAVSQALKPFKVKDPETLKAYQENKSTILDNVERSALEALTPAKLKKASSRDLAIVFGTIYDKNRLEQGKSTANVATFARMITEDEDDL